MNQKIVSQEIHGQHFLNNLWSSFRLLKYWLNNSDISPKLKSESSLTAFEIYVLISTLCYTQFMALALICRTSVLSLGPYWWLPQLEKYYPCCTHWILRFWSLSLLYGVSVSDLESNWYQKSVLELWNSVRRYSDFLKYAHQSSKFALLKPILKWIKYKKNTNSLYRMFIEMHTSFR